MSNHSYKIELDGLALHHYGKGVYGWGKVSSTDGKLGTLVEWFFRSENAKTAHDKPRKRKSLMRQHRRIF